MALFGFIYHTFSILPTLIMNRKVSSNFQSYSALITTTTQPKTILSKIIQNNDYLEGTLTLLYSLVSNHPSISSEVIAYLNTLSIDEYECRHWYIKICFLILEKTRETSPIKMIVKSNFEVTVFLLELINHENKLSVVKEIVAQINKEKFCNALIKQLATSENLGWLKNAVALFIELEYDFEGLDFLLESEHYFLRNGYLEYISRKIKNGKYEYLNVYYERLNDLNHNVRSRVLQILGNLFNDGFIATKIAEVIKNVTTKIYDKTVIVRKKAICFCSNYLIVNDKEVTNEIDTLYQQILQKSISILKSGQCNETSEILHLVKLSYYYKVTDSHKYFEECFDLVWDSRSKPVLLECIREIIERIDPISFFYSFASENVSFGKIIQSIRFKNIWTERIVADLISNNNSSKASIILSNIRMIDVNHACLYSATKILFNSSGLENLETNCSIYNNVLNYILNNKLRKCKCKADNCELCINYKKLIVQIYKNVSKMNFCNFNILDTTIKILFKNNNLEENIISFLCRLKDKRFFVQIIYSLGIIIDEISNFLDKSENRIKRLNFKVDDIVTENREKRASINRLSMKQNLDSTFIQQSFVDNTAINDTMANNTMIRELNERNENDEIGEYIFYIRENVLFKKNICIFYEFLPIVISMLNDESIGHIAHQTMFKFMKCSSELFLENIQILENGLKHVNDKIRNVSLFSLVQFLITYSAWVDSYIVCLFDALKDSNSILRKNALLSICYLYSNHLLKLKGHGVCLTSVYYDEELKVILLSLFRSLTENDLVNVINECGSENRECVEYLMKLIVNEKVKEGVINKIKNRSVEVTVE